ncbi:MAG TPA: EpsI family protein [Candidatus Omnitrophota bacterium]|nr:EpsI family protein [Candidatus Omnitrophota bacterium]HPN66201.1 EpsI family protein [Candidatus Omnitrophota bacterium]
MDKKDLNTIIAIAMLAVCAVAVFFMSSIKRAPAREVKLMSFPMDVSGWKGTNVEFKDKEYLKQVYEVLGTDKVLIRTYLGPGNERVSMQVVYSDQKRQSFHPPEYCYLGSGRTEMLTQGKADIDLGGGKAMSANESIYQISKSKVLMLDWYTAGDVMTENFYRQQLYFVINQLKGGKSGGSAIRVWTAITDNDTAAALERCRKFIREAVKILPDYL